MSETKISKILTTKKQREDWVNTMKVNLSLNNFGLPPSVNYANTSMAEALQYRAMQELFVRLNLYITTGECQSGSIEFPEAYRRIDYQFSNRTTKNNRVNLVALKKNYFIDVKR